MSKLIITRGLPGSGKTRWAHAWINEDPIRRARVNRDDLRASMFGAEGVLSYEQEQLITVAQRSMVTAVLATGGEVVVDDMNLRLRYARAWADLAAELGAEFEVEDFDVPVQVCIERDQARAEAGGRGVGAEVIGSIHMKFLNGKDRFPPVLASAAEGDWREVYLPDETLPPAWLVDVDGTLALRGERNPHDLSRVGEDTVRQPVANLVDALWRAGNGIVVMSGRKASCYRETVAWLNRSGINFDEIHMRATEDNRNDAVVKREMFFRDVVPRWHVLGALDDRDRVVEMWRDIGLTCAQVAPGDF